jgi:hypothetical protein
VHFRRLERYWAKYPPVHIIQRAFVKVADPKTRLLKASRISPDARSEAERNADAARIAAIKAKAKKRDRGELGILAKLAKKGGGDLSMNALMGRG